MLVRYWRHGFDVALPDSSSSEQAAIASRMVTVDLIGPGSRSFEMSAEASARKSGGHVARFRWPDLAYPVRSIRACILDAGSPADPDGTNWVGVAGNLFPKNDAEYMRIFARKLKRVGSAYADYFVADQIERFFTGSAHFRCCAAVVKGYKAVEIGDAQCLDSAMSGLRKALVDVQACELHWHPRQNREHLEASLLCCLWHVQLASMDAEGVHDTLARLEALASGLSNYFTPSFPITLSLLASASLGWLRSDQQRVDAMADLAVQVYKRGVADADPGKLTLFAELKVSHRAALQSLTLRALTEMDPEAFRAIFQHALRVSGPPASRLHANLLAISAGGCPSPRTTNLRSGAHDAKLICRNP